MEYARQERQMLMEQCKQAAKIADEEGVTLCMECHPNTYTQRLEDALDLMRELNTPCFQMYWQPFQWQSVEENLTYAKAIAFFVCNIHVFQWKGQQRFSLNSGIEEWQSYLREFPAPRTLLLEFMPDNRLHSLPKEADALRKIIGARYESNITV